MRTCSELTQREIADFHVTAHDPQWLRSAYWNALHGYPMSRKTEDRMRAALGLEPLPPVSEMPPCPDCHGEPHAGRCNGKPVAAVIVKPARVVHPDVARMVRGLELCLERKAANAHP